MNRSEEVLSVGEYSEWTVLKKSDTKCKSTGFAFVICKCTCGTVKDVRIRDLLNGSSKSCGCRLENNLRTRGGDTSHRLFNTWSMMRIRCANVNSAAYKYYGALGISVCEEWNDNTKGFRNFLEDMEDSYKEGLTLDRIDSTKNYCKSNCQWATLKQQANNCKSNSLLTIEGLTLTCAEWAGLVGITAKSLNAKVRREGVDTAGFDYKLPIRKVVYSYKGEVILKLKDLISKVVIDNPLATRHSYRLDNERYFKDNDIKVSFADDRRTLEEVHNYLSCEDYDPNWVPEDSKYIKNKYKYHLQEYV